MNLKFPPGKKCHLILGTRNVITVSHADDLKSHGNVPGVPNDHFLVNCSYNVVTPNTTFLRQSSLIFNSPGKKIAALHCQQARVSGNKTPSQPSCKAGVNQPA